MSAKGAEEMSLEWIQMRAEINQMEPETFASKSMRKFKENPLVPIGMNVLYSTQCSTQIQYRLYSRLFGHTWCPDIWPVQFQNGQPQNEPVHDADQDHCPRLHTNSASGRNRISSGKEIARNVFRIWSPVLVPAM